MSNRNKDNKPGVFVQRGIVLRRASDTTGFEPMQVVIGGCHPNAMCATVVETRLMRQTWDGKAPLTMGVPSSLGRMLHNPYLGYGVAISNEELASLSHRYTDEG